MSNRRDFLRSLISLTLIPALARGASNNHIMMGVNGRIDTAALSYILPHEHVLVDFIGADKVTKARYNRDEVYRTALPFLTQLKQAGCSALLECTPAYLGRDVQLLKDLSAASGLHILTNTGYYGASKEKYYPPHVYTESAEQLAQRWIAEFEQGIEGTGIRPGFIKLGADTAPLTAAQRKTVAAGALTHLRTGLTIGIHTGNGAAAAEELSIIREQGAAPEAMVWIHAQNEKDPGYFERLAGAGVWIEFDGLSKDNVSQYLQWLQYMRARNLLHKVLVSQDSGWYHAGEPGGGNYRPYTAVFTHLIPLLRQHGFTEADIQLLFHTNPANAYSIRIRS